ncbi:hypothetical protein ABL850_30475 [Variovorax paradoxus]|jgi:antitoxin ParD1/3/4
MDSAEMNPPGRDLLANSINFSHEHHDVSLPEAMKSFVDEQMFECGHGTSSEDVHEIIRKDQQRLQLRSLLLQGGLSAPVAVVDAAYFDGLRERVCDVGKKVGKAGGR